MRVLRKLIGWLVFLALIGAAYWFAQDYVRKHPQDVPWTSLDLAHPIGAFTGRKLAALGEQPAQCRALLSRASVEHVPVPPRRDGPNCGYANGMRLAGADLRYAPAGVVTSCPVAAAMHLLEERIIQPAALRHLGRRVTDRACGELQLPSAIRALGGRVQRACDGECARYHRIPPGRRTGVSVLGDWSGGGAKAAFLHEVRDGACQLFATVLSPEYNEAHSDHLHLDQAERGSVGWRMCR